MESSFLDAYYGTEETIARVPVGPSESYTSQFWSFFSKKSSEIELEELKEIEIPPPELGAADMMELRSVPLSDLVVDPFEQDLEAIRLAEISEFEASPPPFGSTEYIELLERREFDLNDKFGAALNQAEMSPSAEATLFRQIDTIVDRDVAQAVEMVPIGAAEELLLETEVVNPIVIAAQEAGELAEILVETESRITPFEMETLEGALAGVGGGVAAGIGWAAGAVALGAVASFAGLAVGGYFLGKELLAESWDYQKKITQAKMKAEGNWVKRGTIGYLQVGDMNYPSVVTKVLEKEDFYEIVFIDIFQIPHKVNIPWGGGQESNWVPITAFRNARTMQWVDMATFVKDDYENHGYGPFGLVHTVNEDYSWTYIPFFPRLKLGQVIRMTKGEHKGQVGYISAIFTVDSPAYKINGKTHQWGAVPTEFEVVRKLKEPFKVLSEIKAPTKKEDSGFGEGFVAGTGGADDDRLLGLFKAAGAGTVHDTWHTLPVNNYVAKYPIGKSWDRGGGNTFVITRVPTEQTVNPWYTYKIVHSDGSEEGGLREQEDMLDYWEDSLRQWKKHHNKDPPPPKVPVVKPVPPVPPVPPVVPAPPPPRGSGQH